MKRLLLAAAWLLLSAMGKPPGCSAIVAAVDQAAPAGPVLLASYPVGAPPALKQVAFVYDNALAAMALDACGEPARAARVRAGLRAAAANDRFWHDGRMRNAYRAGPVGNPPALPGWWDAAAGRWAEDPYQVGTATGNVAWAALALLRSGQAQARAAARRLMGWVLANVQTDRGFAGGFFGWEPAPTRLGWISTEHNVDVAAAMAALAPDGKEFADGAALARRFVASMFDAHEGRFWLGTLDDGVTINRIGSGIDAELWPSLLPAAPAAWRRAAEWVRTHHAIDGGYGFRDRPDGVWPEGTAQAALMLNEPALLGRLERDRTAEGWLYAAEGASLSTGLALRPDSRTDDFRYFHLPHLGATAWAILAATGTNPFAMPR